MAKKALGKGLGSLMGTADAETAAITSAKNTLPLSQIKPNKNQPRKTFDEQLLSDLADSIKQNGVLQPLLVRKNGAIYDLVAGERRYQAAKLAGLKEVPVVIKDIEDGEVFKLALIENLQRADLTPMEEARGLKQLIKEKGVTQEEAAKLVSKSRSAITNSLRLLDLPEEVQGYVEQGLLTAGHARAVLSVPFEEGRVKLAEKIVAEKLSVRQAEALAPLFSQEAPVPPRRESAPQSYKSAAKQLKMVLDRSVKVKSSRGKNKIEIEFEDEEDLKRLVTKISGYGAE